MRMTQVMASGVDVDITNFIGKHECADSPPSLFDENGQMRATGSKATLVKALKEETGVSDVSELLPGLSMALIIDGMNCLRRWPFKKDVPFPEVAKRYQQQLLLDVPSDTNTIHFCADRYVSNSLKTAERDHRASTLGTEIKKIYDVNDNYRTPEPKSFFKVSENKAALLNYLCENWVANEQNNPQLGAKKLYLAGGFNDAKKSVLLSNGCITAVPDLESNQEEADTRMILHAIYAAQNDDVKRIVVHANDTDVIVLSLYYYATYLKDLNLQEMWIRTQQDSYLPIHEMANKLDNEICLALPFIHTLSGRDITSYPYFTGNKSWLQRSKEVELDLIATFAEENEFKLTDDINNQARNLLIAVYSNAGDDSLFSSLEEIRAHKFLNKNNKGEATLNGNNSPVLQRVK